MVEEQRFTKYGSGNYLCIYNGIEVFPLRKFKYISFNTGLTLGYSRSAASYDEVVSGCFIPSQSSKVVIYDRKLFFAISLGISCYIPISNNWSIITSIRYQYRLNKILHSDFGFGIGVQYRLKSFTQ